MSQVKPEFTVPVTNENYKNVSYELQITQKHKAPQFPNN